MVEGALGVTISAAGSDKFDPALLAVRRWSGSDVVFDVGANDGRTVLRLDRRLGRPRFYAFEPVAATYRTLVERTAHMKNVRCFQLAMGEAPGRQAIYLNERAALNSFSPTWSADPRSAETEVVEVSTVDQVMSEQEVERIHLLKIDTEGYEMEALRGSEQSLRESRIALVVAEVGFDQSAKAIVPLEEARRYLAGFGYRLQGIYTQGRGPAKAPDRWAGAGYRPEALVYCDALFVCAEIEGLERCSSRRNCADRTAR